MGVPAPSIDWYVRVEDIAELGSGMLEKVYMEDDTSSMVIERSTRVSIYNTTIQRMDNLEENQSTLNISSLVRGSDEGLYTCIGRNEVGNIIGTSATLTVYGKPHLQCSLSK